MLEVEPHIVTILRNRMVLPPEQRSDKAVAEASEALKAPLAVIEQHLSNREYLLGKDFTDCGSECGIGVGIGHDGRGGFFLGAKNHGLADELHLAPAAERSRAQK